MKFRYRLVLLAAFLFAFSLRAANEGRVRGTVLDESQRPVAGAEVIVTREGTQYRQAKTTTENGTFSLLILDATVKYHIHIEKEGFTPLDETLTPVNRDTLSVSYTLTASQK